MARGRVISPDFWTDGNMVRLSAYGRLFYIGLWNFAYCDLGHLDDDALGLKLKILPNDQVDPEGILAELMAVGRIVRITLGDGKTFLSMPSFASWQKPDIRWKTRCPVCKSADIASHIEPRETTPNHAETHQSSSELSRVSPELTETHQSSALREEKRKEKERTELDKTLLAECFAIAFDAWPKKLVKKKAGDAFEVAARTYPGGPQALADIVTKFGHAYAATTPVEFTPALGVWLTGDRWSDSLPVARSGDRRPTRTDQNLDYVAGLLRDQHQPEGLTA